MAMDIRKSPMEDFDLEETKSSEGSKCCPPPKATGLIIGLIILVLVIVGVVGFVLNNQKGLEITKSAQGEWQGVFLTNGQVYFGHVVKENANEVVLENIYYLQVKQVLQKSQDPKNPEPQTEQSISLIKLGEELHGPKDLMRINRNQVLFIEDLKKDGKVVQAIAEYEAKPAAEKKATSAPTAPAVPTTPEIPPVE
ncbi:hypothetical protein HY750_03320 [Candidatus Kuenenbacteria bacterium]|nr:hypothetical protein [Candidatus Kuenenbacteria bacterium]